MEMHQEHPHPQPFPHPGNCSSSSPWPAVDAAVNHHPHHSYHHDPNHPAVQNYPPDPNHPIHQNYPPGPNAHQNFHHDPNYHAHQNYPQDPNYHPHQNYQQDFNFQAHQSYQPDFNHHPHQSYQQDSTHHGPQSYQQGPNHFDHHHHHHGNHPNGSFPPVPFSVRKRPWQGPPPPDHFEGPGQVKLYAAQVSRAPNEESIRRVFEQYGTVVEVFILRNKTTGQLQGSCFVKYATIDEADRAIRALNNQHYFPGEALPMIVRYADGEKERLGLSDKLYVNGLNKEASTKEVSEIFEPYGYIEDLHLLRDEMRQNRGSGFVRFSSRDMALSAIKALNGTFIMRGCMRPLIVRFADPKKPGGIESRGHYAFSSKNIGTHPQEPVRLVSDHGDSIGGFPMHNAPHPVQQASHPPIYQLPNQEPQASSGTQVKPSFPPSQLCRMPPQQAQNTQRSSQSSRVEANETDMQHLTQPSGLIIGEQQSSQTVASSSASTTVPSCHEMAALVECDWSEHTCPDGHKYYYNCETCESRWEKPVELSLCEQQLQTQTQLQNPSRHLQALPSALCTQHNAQTQQEPDHLQTQPETSPVVAPTCV